MAQLAANMKVRYKAEPSVVGWVIHISGENARVFIEGSDKLVPLAELEPAAVFNELTPDEFRVALTRRRIQHPVTDQFLSYKASKTKLLYHQFLPVKKLLESPDQRLLVADEVGTGKTIEAGLIWSELESRAANGLENVWIICPKALVGKWRDEMLQRFGFQLEVLSSEGLRQALVSLERDGVLPPRFAKSVVNLELIRLERNAERFAASPVAWDLTIFDEAHHLRNTDTLSNSLAELICERSKAAVFLTATPLQTGLQDIVNLMATLGVDVAEDPGLLEEQMRWDMMLNDWIRLVRYQPPNWKEEARRSLVTLEALGGGTRPGWVEFRRLVESADMTDRGQRALAVNSARDLQVLSPYMTRTLRSDVDENRPTREAITRVVQFSREEETFYREVYKICLARAVREGIPPGFVTQMPERRTASCVPAVASEVLSRTPEDEEEEERSGFTREEVNILESFAKAALESPDRKLEALYEVLEHVFGELEADRVMIFSTFRGTLRYLEQKLTEEGYSLELMYGPTPARDEDCRRGEKSRDRIASEFRQGKFKVLLASEVAGEGLDFEHCHVVINYDLPWNPMRVEQRIGRCDRFGQTSDKVYIGNLASVGTIEERILSRLYERLKIFERALGDLEVILGEAIASFERDVFQPDLTEQQREELLERIAETIENNERNREAITQSSVISLQGRQLIDSDQDEIREAETRFLSAEELAEFAHMTIEDHLPNSMRVSGAAGEFDIVRNEELRTALQGLLAAYPATHYARTEIARFHNRIRQQRATRVSFVEDGEDVEFVHVRHPLLLLARHMGGAASPDLPWCYGVVDAAIINAPTMFVWALGTLEGYTNRVELLCSAVDSSTKTVSPVSLQRAQELLRVMSTSPDGHSPDDSDIETLIARAEETLLSKFKGMTDVFASRDGLLTDKARQAVRSHAQRQISRNERQLSRENLNSNLRNMYVGWNRRLLAETEAKLAEIDRKSGIRSSLEVIGAALIHPKPRGNGAIASQPVNERDQPKAPFGRDRVKILVLGDIVAPIDVDWDAESDPDRVLNP